MGSGGGGNTSSTTTQNIAPQLQPLFENTANILQGVQGLPGADLGQFFNPQVQNIPQATPGQQSILGLQQQRAFGPVITGQEQFAQNIGTQLGSGAFNPAEQAALGQIGYFTGGEIGQSPATQAAMAAVRTPVLNDLALAGLGNSGAVGTDLAGAFAPILAQELAIRSGVIPQLANLGQQVRGGQEFGAGLLGNLGQTLTQRQSGLLGELGQSEEAVRQLNAQQEEARQADILRRQGLTQGITTGLLGGFPSTLGGSTVSRGTSSGGEIFKGILLPWVLIAMTIAGGII